MLMPTKYFKLEHIAVCEWKYATQLIRKNITKEYRKDSKLKSIKITKVKTNRDKIKFYKYRIAIEYKKQRSHDERKNSKIKITCETKGEKEKKNMVIFIKTIITLVIKSNFYKEKRKRND